MSGQNHAQTVIAVTGLTGGTVGAASTSTIGQKARAAWALLSVLGIIGGTVPAQGLSPTLVTANIGAGSMPHSLSQDTIKALFDEIAVQDNLASISTTLTDLFY